MTRLTDYGAALHNALSRPLDGLAPSEMTNQIGRIVARQARGNPEKIANLIGAIRHAAEEHARRDVAQEAREGGL